jgi:MFS family permease
MFPHSPLGALNRDLKILFWATLIWTFGLGIYNYVWPLFLKSLNANPADVGLVYSIGFLAIAASLIPGGILANKYDLKPLVVLGWVVSIPVPLIYYFSHTWTDTIPGFILLEASGFNLPAFNAYIVAVGQRDTTGSNFGTVFASAPLGIAIGPAVGAILLTTLTIRDMFLVSFVLFVVSSAVIFFIKPQPAVTSVDKRIWSLGFPKTRPETILLIFLTGSAIAYGASSFFFPLYFNNVLGLNPVLIQILGSAQQFGAASFAIVLGRRADVRNRGTTMALGLAICATGLSGVLLSGRFLLALPMMFLFGAARGPSIVGYSILSSIRKGANRAGQYGLYLTLENLGLVVGSSLGGALFTFDPKYGFVSSLTIFLALILFIVLTGFGTKAEAETAES